MTTGGDPVSDFAAKLGLKPQMLTGIIIGWVGLLLLIVGSAIDVGPMTFIGFIGILAGFVVAAKSAQPARPPVVLSTTPVSDAVRQQRLQEYL